MADRQGEAAVAEAAQPSANIQVDATDVVRVVLQFLRESGFRASVDALTQESGVSLNAVDNLEQLLSAVRKGRWDAVLNAVSTLRLPLRKLFNLYEQIALELMEMREIEVAKVFLRTTDVLDEMRREDSTRYLRLEHLLAKLHFDSGEAFGAEGRERRREKIASELSGDITTAPPSRLMALIGESLMWQQHVGALPRTGTVDLLQGRTHLVREDTEVVPRRLDRTIKFADKAYALSLAFSPDGQFFVSGSIDGFIEVWDIATGRLRKDLAYQAQDKFMMHKEGVLALAFSRDSEWLASGSQDGALKVWSVRTGQCARKFDHAHAGGVTCVLFSRDGGQVYSGGVDGLVRVHGLKSARQLKEFRGHGSYVNKIAVSSNATLVSASSDGTVRMWDMHTAQCLRVVRPPQPPATNLSVVDVAVVPAARAASSSAAATPTQELVLVCSRQSAMHLYTLQGQLVRTLAMSATAIAEAQRQRVAEQKERQPNAGKKEDKAPPASFVSCFVSPDGELCHGISEDSKLMSYRSATGEAVQELRLHDSGAIGMIEHPLRAVFASHSTDGTVRMWRAE